MFAWFVPDWPGICYVETRLPLNSQRSVHLGLLSAGLKAMPSPCRVFGIVILLSCALHTHLRRLETGKIQELWKGSVAQPTAANTQGLPNPASLGSSGYTHRATPGKVERFPKAGLLMETYSKVCELLKVVPIGSPDPDIIT